MDKQNQNNNQPKMPKFNTNWIVLLVLIISAVFIFSGNNNPFKQSSTAITKDYTTFLSYVDSGYAARVVVNKRASLLRMYVKPQHIRDVFKSGVQQVGTEPYVKVEIGSVDNLEAFLNDAMQKRKIGSYSYDNSNEDGFTDMLISFITNFIISPGSLLTSPLSFRIGVVRYFNTMAAMPLLHSS